MISVVKDYSLTLLNEILVVLEGLLCDYFAINLHTLRIGQYKG